jgi:enoyl-CoA hydratase/carnithine racemase
MVDEIVFDREGDIVFINLNRPQKRNALSFEMLDTIRDFFQEEAKREKPARVVIIKTQGEVFSAGMDIKDVSKDMAEGGPNYLSDENHFEVCFRSIEDYPFPVIAQIKGPALGGGCMLAASADIRVGAEGMTFAITPTKMGVVYPPAGFRRLGNIVGPSFAKEMIFTSRTYDDETALRTGFVTHLVPPEELDALTADLAGHILETAPLALGGSKTIFKLMDRMVPVTDPRLFEIVHVSVQSEDAKEGFKAPLEKRKPDFKGR